MSQLAKLYLRGRGNHILRDLTPSQQTELDNMITVVMDDSLLQNCKHEFCAALRRTIKNEYYDKEAGLQEYRIALMRALIAAKYDTKKLTSEKTLTDPIQRKKWCQTYAFNYLRQILTENKIPGYRQNKKIDLPADEAAVHEINELIRRSINKNREQSERKLLREAFKTSKVVKEHNRHFIMIEQWILPADLIMDLQKLAEDFVKHKIQITQEEDRIKIQSLNGNPPTIAVFQKQETRVSFVSFESEDDEKSHRDQLEYISTDAKGLSVQESNFFDSDLIRELRERIPDDAREVLDVILDPPIEYVQQFGEKVRKVYLAKYLGRHQREINKTIDTIKIHCMSLGIGIDD